MDNPIFDFDWNKAKAFLAAAEEGSFSAAARALNSTQPTIGRQVSALEHELGVTLFERVGQGLELTSCGLELFENVKKMGNAASNLSLLASGRSQEIEGNVCISVGEIDAFYRIPTIISVLRKQSPGIRLETIVSNEVTDLKRREADIALRCFRPTQPDLIAKKLCDEPLYLYASQQYLDSLPFNHKNIDSFEDITQVEYLGFDQSTQFIQHMKKIGVTVTKQQSPILTRFQLLHLQLAKQHLGLTVFPEIVDKKEPELEVAFPQLGPIFKLPLWLVCHRELHTSRRVRKVFDVLAELIK